MVDHLSTLLLTTRKTSDKDDLYAVNEYIVFAFYFLITHIHIYWITELDSFFIYPINVVTNKAFQAL